MTNTDKRRLATGVLQYYIQAAVAAAASATISGWASLMVCGILSNESDFTTPMNCF